jgi:hypothetical protein
MSYRFGSRSKSVHAARAALAAAFSRPAKVKSFKARVRRQMQAGTHNLDVRARFLSLAIEAPDGITADQALAAISSQLGLELQRCERMCAAGMRVPQLHREMLEDAQVIARWFRLHRPDDFAEAVCTVTTFASSGAAA